MAAARLAASGLKTTLIDEKPPWEKPCGGGVTFKAYNQYPFLLENDTAKRVVSHTWLHAPNVGGVRMDLNQPLLIYSRKDLNAMLLDRAVNAGAEVAMDRVTSIDRSNNGWNVETKAGKIETDYVVLATGARNSLKQYGTSYTAADTMYALGYYVPTDRQQIDIQFLENLEGYIWVFPRCGHLSVGICGKGETAQALRARLEAYMILNELPLKDSTFYAHVLPSLESQGWSNNRVAGDCWVAVGDAAGLVDPITGEGIYYAMRSGDLAGQLIGNHIEDPTKIADSYRNLVATDFTDDLAYGATIAKRVFLGRFLYGSNPSRMVQFLRRSPGFTAIMQEVFAGTITYFDLRRRLLASMNRSISEIAANILLGRKPSPSVGI